MISSNEIRNRQISAAQGGYNKDEVNLLLDEAADTVDAYVAESKELYHKLEVLAGKVEEYRAEEDSIKTALIAAQKMAEQIEQDSKSKAEALETGSQEKAKSLLEEALNKADEIVAQANAKAQATTDEADAKSIALLAGIEERDNASKENAEKLITETREYCKKLIADKTAEATSIITDAEAKANEAINSSKIVAQNILDQAKEISDELVAKSKEEKEAYELLVGALKNDAKSFIDNLKALYTEQLDVLNGAKLESDSTQAEESTENVASIHEDVENLVSEMTEIGESIPETITLEKPEVPVEEIPEEEPVAEAIIEEVVEEEEINIFEDVQSTEEATQPEEDIAEEVEEDEEPTDPMAAVEAFSQNEITPIDDSVVVLPEINEEPEMQEAEKSLFDDEAQLPFESYFNVKREDAHFDRTQTISLIPPEDEDGEDGEEPKFKGFFKKKK